MNAIEKFIKDFKIFEKDEVLENTFRNGYCYYFSVILNERFGGEIVYETIDCHFLFLYHGRLYDIRGDVTDLYNFNNISYKEEWMRRDSVISGVILKI